MVADNERPVRPGDTRPDPTPIAPPYGEAGGGAVGSTPAAGTVPPTPPSPVAPTETVPPTPPAPGFSAPGAAFDAAAPEARGAQPSCGGVPPTSSGGTSAAGAPGVQPVVVNVEQRRLGKGLTAFIVVAVTLFLLLFGGCTCATTSMVGGVAAYLAGDGIYDTAGSQDQIAVFHMDQTIDATSGITPELVRDLISQVNDDPQIVALVVRCDCGGGGAAASDEIATYFARCTKPVVFSVGTLCASGAYMAASQADWIVANPSSEVGAIGTLITLYNLEGLYDMLGIEGESIKSSESKDMGAEYRSLTDEERARLQSEVDRLAEMFVQTVARGRGVDESVVSGWADGTTYLGVDAVKMGMIDELGTLDEALERAAELAGVAYDDCEVVYMDPYYSELDMLTDLLG